MLAYLQSPFNPREACESGVHKLENWSVRTGKHSTTGWDCHLLPPHMVMVIPPSHQATQSQMSSSCARSRRNSGLDTADAQLGLAFSEPQSGCCQCRMEFSSPSPRSFCSWESEIWGYPFPAFLPSFHELLGELGWVIPFLSWGIWISLSMKLGYL